MFMAVFCGGNEAYHLAVWPSWHAEGRIECGRHPAAPAEALEFAHLADEFEPVLSRSRGHILFTSTNLFDFFNNSLNQPLYN